MLQQWMENGRHMRFSLAFLAMLGALWASVDLHQHESGLHKPVECSICSLENSVAHGFAPQSSVQPLSPAAVAVEPIWQQRQQQHACLRTACIRAPPSV